MSHTYTIAGKNNTLTMEGELSTYPSINFGGENTFEFYLQTDQEVSDSDTDYTTYGFQYASTYPGGESLLSASDRYQLLKEYQKYAGYTEVSRTLGDVFYHTNADFARSDIDSMVVKVTPSDDIESARGVWGVISDIQDETQRPNWYRLNVTVQILADSVEFETHSEIETEFKSNL